MKITKRQLKRIIREEGYYSKLPKGHVDGQPWTGSLEDLAYHQGRTWGHGEVVDQQGFKGNIQKSKKLATGRDHSPLQMTEAQLKKIINEYHPRPDDDHDPLNPDDEFEHESPEDDMDYDRGLEAGCYGWPRDTGFGPAYDDGYDQGEMDAKDPDSECNQEHAEEFGPDSPGMMGPRREGKMKITKRQLRRIIKEELKRELISEVDTSADGSFSSQWEKVEVQMDGVGDGVSAYQHASNDQLDVDDLMNWLESDYLEEEPTMNRIGDDIGWDEGSLAEAEEAWKKLVELGLDDWDMSDRKELASNIRKAVEEGEEQAQSW